MIISENLLPYQKTIFEAIKRVSKGERIIIQGRCVGKSRWQKLIKKQLEELKEIK